MSLQNNKIVPKVYKKLYCTKNFKFFENFIPDSLRLKLFEIGQKKIIKKNKIKLDKHENVLAQKLKKNGFFVIENYISRNEAIRYGKKNKYLLDKISSGKSLGFPNKFTSSKVTGVSRIDESNKICDISKKLFEDQKLDKIVKFSSCNNLKKKIRMELRKGKNSVSPDDNIHFDDYPWGHRIKAFLYLCDVDEKNSPLVFFPSSHSNSEWRKPKEIDCIKNGHLGSWGHFTDNEVEELKTSYNFEEKIFSGKAGTLIVVNTIGLHKSTPPKKENVHRVNITLTWENAFKGYGSQ